MIKNLTLFILLLTVCSLRAEKTDSTAAAKLSAKAVYLISKEYYDSAISIAHEAYRLALLDNDSIQMAKCLNNIGYVYKEGGDPLKGMLYYQRSLKLLRQLNVKDEIYVSMYNIGVAYKEQNVNDSALIYLFAAATYFEKSGDIKKLSNSYNAIGNILKDDNDYSKSLSYHFKALKLRKQINFEGGIAGSMNNIGAVYKEMKEYDLALKYLDSSMQIKTEKSKHDKLANTLSLMGDVYVEQKMFQKAEYYYEQAFTIRKKIKNKLGIAQSYNELGKMYYQLNNYSKSKQYLLNSIKYAKEINASEQLMKSHVILKDIYKHQDNYKKAFYHLEQYVSIYDSISGETPQAIRKELEFKYENDRREREKAKDKLEYDKIKAENHVKELKIQARERGFIIILLVALALLIVIILLIDRYRHKRKEALDKEKMMHETHHRVKNNFQVLLAMFRGQLRSVSDAMAQSVLSSNVNRVEAMVLIHQDLYLNKVERVNISEYVRRLVANLQTVYKEKQVDVDFRINTSINMDVDKALPLGLVINELVTNAFKYAFVPGNSRPLLSIVFDRKAIGTYMLVIKDNGPGIQQQPDTYSFGLKLAEAQARQLRGNLEKSYKDGLCYELVFG